MLNCKDIQLLNLIILSNIIGFPLKFLWPDQSCGDAPICGWTARYNLAAPAGHQLACYCIVCGVTAAHGANVCLGRRKIMECRFLQAQHQVLSVESFTTPALKCSALLSLY